VIKPNVLFKVQKQFLVDTLKDIDNQLLYINSTNPLEFKHLSRSFFVLFQSYIECSSNPWGSDTPQFAFYVSLSDQLKIHQINFLRDPESSFNFLKIIQNLQTELQS